MITSRFSSRMHRHSPIRHTTRGPAALSALIVARSLVALIAAVLAGPTAVYAAASNPVGPDNANSLTLAWDLPLSAGVTSSPTVEGDRVYVTSWDGKLYALDRATGVEQWSFDTGTAAILGVQSTLVVAADGSLLFGDSAATVHRLDAAGGVIWQRSVGNPAIDHIWSAVAVSNGRVFVGVAGHDDQPCSEGRTVALDFATGVPLWTRSNVPDGVCRNDTSVTCTSSLECGGATCENAVGAGVSSAPVVDATGSFVYTNTVGCFTFPSIGDSDSIMKLDASNGDTVWITRVDPPEQFGFCNNDSSIECGTDAVCGGGTCTTKTNYHDFGFLNGPLLVQTDLGAGPEILVVSGSKNGTVYALRDDTGSIEWSNPIQPTPVSPNFAGFGLFNGALSTAAGRLHAALYEFSPPALPAPEHLMTLDVSNGNVLWTDEIGIAWSSTSVSNDVVFVGTNLAAEFYAYHAATGERLSTFPLPAFTVSQATVVGGDLFIGYGVFGGVGGIRAYSTPERVPSLAPAAFWLLGLLLFAFSFAVHRRT